MVTTVVFEVRSREESQLAERALRARGYAVARVGRSPYAVQVQAQPGEKPQAALRSAGVEFTYRLAEAPSSSSAN